VGSQVPAPSATEDAIAGDAAGQEWNVRRIGARPVARHTTHRLSRPRPIRHAAPPARRTSILFQDRKSAQTAVVTPAVRDRRLVASVNIRFHLSPEAPMSEEREDTTVYTAVVNHEEQYSIWPADRELPAGWSAVGEPGAKERVLAWIEEVWTDMRPLSLRRRMETADV
jgi:MbtH protein